MSSLGLLIYDGDCGFCTSSAQWYARRAGIHASIEMWQALDLEPLGLTSDQAMESLWFRRADGSMHPGADGCAEAMKIVGGPWRFTGYLLGFPGVIHVGRLIYPLIAKYRYRLPGGTPACKL